MASRHAKGVPSGRSSMGKDDDEVPRKVNLRGGKSKLYGDGDMILENEKKDSKRLQRRGNHNGEVSDGNVYRKLSKAGGREKRVFRTNVGNERPEAVMNSNPSHKRKRIHADPGLNGDRTYNGKAKSLEVMSTNKIDDRMFASKFDKEKKMKRGNRNELGESSVSGTLKSKRSDSLVRKNLRGPLKNAHMVNDLQNKMLSNKRHATLAVEGKLSQSKYSYEGKPFTKSAHDKKGLDVDTRLKEDLPKKKKRVIRLDPHDISNKRLNDHIPISASSGNTTEKEALAEKNDVHMSKNAMFRAILPSSSILSFVEDNLLGRRREILFRRAGYNIELSVPLDNIPFSTSSERERIEIPVFRNKLEFFAAAKISSSFPPPDFPEIAFAGRSNVGKSSLLNALTRQWGVVRTSDKPGLTQTINFFKLGPKLSLVDLPGYGFAYAKDEVKEAWEELVKEYVTSRVNLNRVCLLIDTKWGMKPRDYELIDLMERSKTRYQIVLTKTDLVFPIAVARRAMQIEESLKANKSVIQPLMMISSKTGAGIRSLRTVLSKVTRFVKR